MHTVPMAPEAAITWCTGRGNTALADKPGALHSAAGQRMPADPARSVRQLADLLGQAWQVLVERGIGGLWTEAADRTPGPLARLLGRARADVLCALDQPAGASALAHRLSLAASSVSAHLPVLRAAGLLTSRRYGHQVLYERTPLGMALVGADGPPGAARP
ncbi:DNA-binding transcriptional ArsR family regulator [Streptomyces sp. B1I3]|nr:DNA-binding transcriptional ArsR family regulator [Streptomyces sp. B1I3]